MRFLLFFYITVMCGVLSGQGQWSWMHGSSTAFGLQPAYGTLGVANATNTPGGRYGGASWTDNAGNLWLFGGLIDWSSPKPYVADMWKYNPVNNQWTWMSGPSSFNPNPQYGTLGVPSVTNNPGSRINMCTWTDNTGNFWLYGGFRYLSGNYNFYSDLWKYTVATNEWTWVHGSNTLNSLPVYGTLNVASSGNTPGGLGGAIGCVDSNGTFWLFGGEPGGSATTNAMWQYDPATNMWTWRKSNGVNVYPSYALLGVSNATANPGTRARSLGFADQQGNFWIFGGHGQNGFSADLWKYNFQSAEWGWMGGTQGAFGTGIYNSTGVVSHTIYPHNRYGTVHMQENNGSIRLMGGYGALSGYPSARFNDVWKFFPMTNTWMWESGSNASGDPSVYGNYQSSCNYCKPGGRSGHYSWKDNSGNFWIYGGEGIGNYANGLGHLNDMWKMNVCQSPPLPVASTPSASLRICSGASATLTASGNNVVWYTSATTSLAAGQGSVYITGLLNASQGSSLYTLYTEATGSCGLNYARIAQTVTVEPLPVPVSGYASSTTICAGETVTLSASGPATYSWSSGNTTQTFTIQLQSSQTFSVWGYGNAGCPTSNTAIVNVAVNPSPLITVNISDSLLCLGETLTITPSGAVTYTFDGLAIGNNYTVTPSTDTIVTIIGTDINLCMGTVAVGVKVEDCLSVEQTELPAAIKAYPNPTTGKFTLIFGENIEIVICDLFGRTVYKGRLSDVEPDLSEQPAGMYFISFPIEQRQTLKIIKL